MRVALPRAFFSLLFFSLLYPACKRSSPADLTSPEATLESFFKALKESRLPDELGTFVTDEVERAAWQLRCKTRGCKGGDYRIVEVKERGEGGAILIVDYEIYGNQKVRVMGGQASPLRFEKQGGNWGIVQFGVRLSAKDRTKEAQSPTGTD